MEKSSDRGRDEGEKTESKSRRPRRLKNTEEDDERNNNNNVSTSSRAESKSNLNQSVNRQEEPQQSTKPRRRRLADEDENNNNQGDGGWFGGDNKVQSKKPQTTEEEDRNTLATQNKDKHFNEDVADVIIPDLDDEGGENDERVAHAPRNLSRKLPLLDQLENEATIMLHSNKGGIDLSVLLETLVPPEMLNEDDQIWDFDTLLRGITEELTKPRKAESKQ